jgi:hypothetical protein
MWKTTRIIVMVLMFMAFASACFKNQTAFCDTASHDIYVNGATGSDAGTGTVDQPFKSIGKAVAAAMRDYKAGTASSVHVAAGVYREALQMEGGDQPNPPQISIQGANDGSVVLSGADVWTGWKADATNPQIYSHAWTYRWGECVPPKEWPQLQKIALRREMIFVNGHPLRQVLASSQLKENSFFVDESGGAAYIMPAANVDMNSAIIEVSTRPTLLHTNHVSNFSLSGLKFVDANSCITSYSEVAAVILANASNISVHDLQISWSNWQGLAFFKVENLKAKSIRVDHNGENGISGWKLKSPTMEDITSSYNDWRGLMGGFDRWDVAGSKFFAIHDATFSNYTSIGNGGRGIWFDSDSKNITLTNATLARNTQDGIDIEKNEGPVTVRNATMCGNGVYGVFTNSQQVTLEDDALFGNGKAQLSVQGYKPEAITDFENGTVYSISQQGIRLTHNTFRATGEEKLLDMKFGNPDVLRQFTDSLKSDRNSWNGEGFQVSAPLNNVQNMKFGNWKHLTNQEGSSTASASPGDASASQCPN